MALESSLQNRYGLTRLAIGLAIICLLVNFAAQWPAAHRVEFSSEACHVSWALQNGRGFADPYLTGPSGPTAHVAPLYPLLHALLCLIFGTGGAGWAAIVAITSLAWVTQWMFVYRFAALWGEARTGAAAAIIGVLLPLPGRMFKWEAVFVGAAMAAAAFELSRIVSSTATRWTALRFGLLLGAGAVFSPVTILVWPAWGLIVLIELGWKRARSPALTALVIALLPAAAWTLRNYAAFRHFEFVRGNLGTELGVSNNDCATALESRNRACSANYHPSGNSAVLDQLVREGEVRFNAAAWRRAKDWIRSHPRRFAVLSLERAAFYWFPADDDSRTSLIYGFVLSVVTIFSFFSVTWMRCTGFWVAISALLPFSAMYYFVQAEQRYIYPTLWARTLLACIGGAWILARNRQAKRRLQAEAERRFNR